MQQPQDNEFTRAEEIRKLRVIPELISHHLEIRGDDPAVCQFNAKTKQWETLSFKELYARALDWANAFVASGLKKGDRVAMLLPNGIDAVCFDQGALIAGMPFKQPAPICLSSAQSSTSMMNPNLKAKRFAALTLLNG